jgi:hypothetical protein
VKSSASTVKATASTMKAATASTVTTPSSVTAGYCRDVGDNTKRGHRNARC